MHNFLNLKDKSLLISMIRSHFAITLAAITILSSLLILLHWQKQHTFNLVEDALPLSELNSALQVELNKSNALLSKYIFVQDDQFKQARKTVWQDNIPQVVTQIEMLLHDFEHDKLATTWMSLKSHLATMASIQWQVEDIANNPGNQVADFFFNTRIQPLIDHTIGHLKSMIEQHMQVKPTKESFTLLKLMADFKTELAYAVELFVSYIHSGDGYTLKQHNSQMQIAAKHLQLIVTLDNKFNHLQASELQNIQNAYFAISALLKSAQKKRDLYGNNIAKHIFSHQLSDASSQVQKTLSELHTLHRASLSQNIISIKAVSNHVPIVTAILMLILVALSYWLASRNSRRLINPINQIIAATKRITQGEKKLHLDIHTNGELAELTRNFNKMNIQRTAEEEKINAILETALDPIILTNSTGIIILCNKSTATLFGYNDPNEFIGKNVSMFTPEPHRSKHDGYLKHYRETREAKIIGNSRVVEAVKKDGSMLPVQLSLNKLEIDGEMYFTAFLRDLSAQKAYEDQLIRAQSELELDNKEKSLIAEIDDLLRGSKTTDALAYSVLSFLNKHFATPLSVFYLRQDDQYTPISDFGLNETTKAQQSFTMRDGLLAKAASACQPLPLYDLPAGAASIKLGLTEIKPSSCLLLPLCHRHEAIGVLELYFTGELNQSNLALFTLFAEKIAITLNSAISRDQLTALLNQTQEQSLVLQQHEEELRVTNAQLQEQADSLKRSEEILKVQSEELRVANEELAEKIKLVETQRSDIIVKNKQIEEKAKSLETANEYKSEILANTSHELRTPLNSLLLLSAGLMKNTEGTLTEDQQEDIAVIHRSGKTLLDLINDILDLSKIDAGKLSIDPDEVYFKEMMANLNEQFTPIAQRNNIDFTIENNVEHFEHFYSDPLRIEQIIRNLLSNSMKFTKGGKVSLNLYIPDPEELSQFFHTAPENMIAFLVSDTGIGIAQEKQETIFSAFHQADGSTARHYGGTGLGLTISQKLAHLLSGHLCLKQSALNKGSQFVLYVPQEMPLELRPDQMSEEDFNQTLLNHDSARSIEEKINHYGILPPPYIADDRADFSTAAQSVLIVEDDEVFAKFLVKLAHSRNFQCLAAKCGQDALALAEHFQPKSIILDMTLPDMDGKSLIDVLKNNTRTSDIPIHVVSGRSEQEIFTQCDPMSFLQKPVSEKDLLSLFAKLKAQGSTTIRNILVVDQDDTSMEVVAEVFSGKAVNVEACATGKKAIERIVNEKFDCAILEYTLEDMNAIALLSTLDSEDAVELPHIIIHSNKQLSEGEYKELTKFTSSFIIKGSKSHERLLDEVTLFFHEVEHYEPLSTTSPMLKQLTGEHEDKLKKSKILLVDDDLQNCFSLSKLLKKEGVQSIIVDSGSMAIEKLKEDDKIDLILMDIMMPEMDGYDTTKVIRQNKQYKDVPIIALTAKAMPEDRQKCLDAGASDYLTKPIDMGKLINLMKVWIESP